MGRRKLQQNINRSLFIILILFIFINITQITINAELTDDRGKDNYDSNCDDLMVEKLSSYDSNYGTPTNFAFFTNSSNEYAFLAIRQGGILVIDISDKSSPLILLTIFDEQPIRDIEIENDLLYLINNNTQLEVYSISNVINPIKITTYFASGTISEYKKFDTIIVLHISESIYHEEFDYYEEYSYISFINFTSIISPQQISVELEYSHLVYDFLLSEDYLFLAGSRLFIYNITDILNPQLIYNSSSQTYQVEKVDQYLIITTYNQLQILDLCNITKPITSIVIDIDNYSKFVLKDYYLLLYDSFDFKVFEIAIPSNCQLVVNIADIEPTMMHTFYTHTFDLYLLEDYVFFLLFNGFAIYDISDIKSPKFVYSFYGSGQAKDIQVIGTLAYIANGFQGLQILNCSNPWKPKLVTEFLTKGCLVQICVYNGIAFLMNLDYHIQVVNITNPNQPYEINHMTFLGPNYYYKKEMVAQDEILFIATSFRGCVGGTATYLTLYNISNPLNIIQITTYTCDSQSFGIDWNHDFGSTTRWSMGLQIIEKTAYLCNGFFDLIILDISDVYFIRQLGSLKLENTYCCNLWVEGDLAFLGDSRYGLLVVDVSNPYNLHVIDKYYTNNSNEENYFQGVQSVQYDGKYLYACDYDDGLLIFDLTSEQKLSKIGEYNCNDYHCKIIKKSNLLFVANYENGLEILHIKGMPILDPFEAQSLTVNQYTFFTCILALLGICSGYIFNTRKNCYKRR